MINKKLTLSIVIPVFNEENYIADCLNSIAAQSELPDEVIIVDNNSSDRSIEIAKKYSFVRVIREKRQHQSFGQKTGFDAASGEIIGRIDADSILPKDWTHQIKRQFALEPQTVAIVGSAWPYDVQLKRISVAVFELYNRFASLVAGNRMLWGANCALRKSAWRKISGQVLLRGDIWEDYDISFLLSGHGDTSYRPDLKVEVSFRAVHKSFFTQFRYQFRSVRTFYLRKGLLKAIFYSLLWYTMILFYPLVLLDEFAARPIAETRSRRREILESPALVD